MHIHLICIFNETDCTKEILTVKLSVAQRVKKIPVSYKTSFITLFAAASPSS